MSTPHYNSEVTEFLDGLNHPFREEIEATRTLILNAQSELTENIKWNGPNYSFQGEDRITMRILPPKQVQLIFHRGAKKQTQPADKLIQTSGNLLLWKENDRAIASFKTMSDIENNRVELAEIVQKWIEASKS